MKFLANLTLGKKLILLTTLGLILGISVFSFLGIRAVNQATEAMLQDRMTTAHLVADYLDEALGRALTELERTATLVGNNGAEDNLRHRAEALEEVYNRLSIYTHRLYFLNERGEVMWSKPETSAIEGHNLFFYPSIDAGIKSGASGISALVSDPVTGTPVVFLTSPVEDERQENKDMLVAAIDLSRSSIGGFVQPIRLGQTGYVEIIDQNGVVVARTSPGPELAPFEKSDHSNRFAELIAAGEPTRGLCHTCHEPIRKVERRDVLAFVPLSETRWGVVIRQSEKEALAPINELRQNLFLFGGGLAVITLLFVAITTHDVVSRIKMLTTASERIAGGDLASPITVAQKDEIGILALTFEGMRNKLKASYGELGQKTKELSSLLSVSEIFSHLSDLSNLDIALGSALDKTLEIMKEDTGSILLLDEEKQLLCCRVHRNLYREDISKACYRLGEGICGKAAQTGKVILVEDISTDPRFARSRLMAVEGLHGFASIPIWTKERVLGVLNIASREARKFSSDDVQLLEGIARGIAAAVENAKLHQEVQHKEEVRGELLKDILAIQEEERKRIARELHDETSQAIASLVANLEASAGMLPAAMDKPKALLRKAQSLSISILDGIHKLIYELRPSLLDDLGLVAATRWLADNNLRELGVKVDFRSTGRKRRLSSRLETTLFRVIQEAVYNIAKHARARNTSLSLHFKKNAIRVNIRDDGTGFDVAEAISSKDRPRGLGLLGMKERVELLNGTLNIQSRPGAGTEINIEIPFNGEVSNG